MIEVLSALAVLVVVLIGLLIMVQAILPSEALRVLGRALVGLLPAVLGFYGLRTLWTSLFVPWFSAGLAALKASLTWLAVTLVALIALLLFARVVFKQFGRHFTLRHASQRGNTHDHDHY